MPPTDESPRALKITAISVPDAARMMASAYGRRVTEDQVRAVAETGGLLRGGDTINLLEYVAFLVRNMSQSPHAAATD